MPRLTAKPLTQKIIDYTPLPTSRFILLRDPDQRGLAVRVWASGAKTWTFEYRNPVSGTNARIGLPDGSLAEARARAKEFGRRSPTAAIRPPPRWDRKAS